MLNKKLLLLLLINNGLEAFRSSNPDYSNNKTDNYHVIDRSYKPETTVIIDRQKPTLIIDRNPTEIVVLETPKIYYETPIRQVVSTPVVVSESSFGTFLLGFIGIIGAIFIIGVIISPSKKNIIIKNDESNSSIATDPIDSALNGKNPSILDHRRDSYLNHMGYNNNDPYYLLNTANLNEQKFEKLIRGIIDDNPNTGFKCRDKRDTDNFAENILIKFQKNTLDLLHNNHIQNLLIELNKKLSISFEFKENVYNKYKSNDFYQLNDLISKLIFGDTHVLILYDSNNLEELLKREILNQKGIHENKIYLKKIYI